MTIVPVYPTTKSLKVNVSTYDETYLVNIKRKTVVDKKMPQGIKRPGKHNDYSKYNLPILTRMLTLGGYYDIPVPSNIKKKDFQSAMLNAGFTVFKDRLHITTMTISKDPLILRAIRIL